MNTNEESVVELVEKAAVAVETLSKRQSELEQRLRGLDTEFSELAQKSAAASMLPSTGSAGLRKITSDPRIRNVLSGASKSERIVVDGLNLKSVVINTGANGSTSSDDSGYPSPAQRAPGLFNDPRIALSLAAALPRLAVNSASFEFVKLSNYSNAAAEQRGEGESKAVATVNTELASVRIATFAHTLKVSEQVLADNPALSQSLQNLLGFGCLAKLESALVNFVSGGGDAFDGLIQESTAFVPTATTAADAFGECAAELRTMGWNPTHALLSPNDWFKIASERDQQGAYVSSAWGQPVPASLWGLSVIVCPSLSDGTGLVIDAAQLALLDRQQVVVEIGRSGDDFERNLFTLRAELRAALAVMSSASVARIDLEAFTSSSSE
jgi:HK97 family phage major capsid protein